MKQYLTETRLLNYSSDIIQNLIGRYKWNNQGEYFRIKGIYDFVQNHILFGYNKNDYLLASEVVQDGYGQCNTKATLLMALLRGVGVPCRLHAFAVKKDFQKGVTTKLISIFAPKHILHTWVEVFFNNEWIALEGVITDKSYQEAIISKYGKKSKIFNKYAIATKDLGSLSSGWEGKSTYVQSEAIVEDYGIFNSPDELFKIHKQDIGKIKEVLYSIYGCKRMTKNVEKIRQGKIK